MLPSNKFHFIEKSTIYCVYCTAKVNSNYHINEHGQSIHGSPGQCSGSPVLNDATKGDGATLATFQFNYGKRSIRFVGFIAGTKIARLKEDSLAFSI